jgi:S1/P1 Nuclease
MRTTIGLCVVGIASALPIQTARAWGNVGHMEVACGAYDRLDPAVRAKVDRLLKLNPQYDSWVQDIDAGQQGKVAFVMAARWPDWIKTQKGYTADGTQGGDRPPEGAESSQNIGYSDKLMHKYWHFYDKPLQAAGDNTPTQPPPVVNAKTEIAILRKALKSSSTSDGVKSYDLVWLEHLVGDVHQPLHCTSRFDKDDPQGDAGGNRVKLCSTPKCRKELHGLWDDFPGTSVDPQSAIAKAAKLPDPDATQAKISDESAWIDESWSAAQEAAYVKPIGVGDGPFKDDAGYRAQGRKVSSERIALAATRLANLLNDALK